MQYIFSPIKYIVKFILIIYLIGISPTVITAQDVDYNRIIIPKNVQVQDIGERLVQLAWQNGPVSKIKEHEINVADYEIKLNRRSFMREIGFVFNVNQFSFQDPEGGNNPNQFYPNYNFFIRLTFDQIFNSSLRSKTTKEGKYIVLESVKQEKLDLRQRVLTSYYNYLLKRDIYSIKLRDFEETNLLMEFHQNQFEKGEIDYDIYMQTVEKNNNVLIEKLNTEFDLKIAELELENLIGLELESVLD